MLTSKERARFLELQKKMNEPHTPLTDKEIDKYEENALDYRSTPIGFLQGFTEYASSVGTWTKQVAYDNLRLVEEIRFLKDALQICATQLLDKDEDEIVGNAETNGLLWMCLECHHINFHKLDACAKCERKRPSADDTVWIV